jgi:uncharacterized protein YaeQ
VANKTSIYKVNIDISNIDQHRYQKLCFTVALAPKESLSHLAMRLIAYAMVPEEKLSFGHSNCMGLAPDVMVKDYDDHYIYWIDIGFPALGRLKKASCQADNVVVFSLNKSDWLDDSVNELMSFSNLHLVLFQQDVIEQLCQTLGRQIHWSIVIDGNKIGIADSQHYVESQITRMNGTGAPSMAYMI